MGMKRWARSYNLTNILLKSMDSQIRAFTQNFDNISNDDGVGKRLDILKMMYVHRPVDSSRCAWVCEVVYNLDIGGKVFFPLSG
jgi:hypothetical protein